MKYNQFSFEDQVTKNYQLIDRYRNILGMDVYTSVITPLPKTILIVSDIRNMLRKFSCIGGHSLKAFIVISFWEKHCFTA